jgi:hypothetical protein
MSDTSRVMSLSLQATVGKVLEMRLRPIPATYFPIFHYQL